MIVKDPNLQVSLNVISPVISYYSYGFCLNLYLKNENVRAVHISL